MTGDATEAAAAATHWLIPLSASSRCGCGSSSNSSRRKRKSSAQISPMVRQVSCHDGMPMFGYPPSLPAGSLVAPKRDARDLAGKLPYKAPAQRCPAKLTVYTKTAPCQEARPCAASRAAGSWSHASKSMLPSFFFCKRSARSPATSPTTFRPGVNEKRAFSF